MKLPRFAIYICLILVLSPAAARADLTSDINTVLADPLLAKAKVGVDIVRLGSSEQNVALLAEANSTTPLIPASNLKVITTSAALQKLGPEFSFHTLLLQHDSDLILVGDGDPTFGDAELLKKVGWDVDTVYKTWAAGLIKRHITTVRNVLVDDSVFDQEFFHPNWPADQAQLRYVAEIAGVNLNVNCIDFYIHPRGIGEIVNFTSDPMTAFLNVKNTCVGGDENAVWLSRQPNTNQLILRGKAHNTNEVPVSVTVHDPPLYAATVLAEVLRTSGITVTGAVLRDRTSRAAYAMSQKAGEKTWNLLAVHETPLANVIARANKDSMNLYAECLCKRLGFAETGTGSWQTGTAAVGDFLASLHIPHDQYNLDDGCGLSKHNAISSNTMVKVLTHDFFSPNSKIWLSTLAVAGEDGTLANRFRGTDLKGRVIAKTGFVNGVSCLSGYLHAKDDNWYCFSIMFNGIPEGSNSSAKPLQERIVRAIDQHTHPALASGQ